MTSEEKTSSPASFRPPANNMFIHLAISLAVDTIAPACKNNTDDRKSDDPIIDSR